jgi:hypothetical protein
MNAGCRPGQSYACTADGVAVFLHAVTGVKTAGETDGTRCPRPAAAAASVDNTDTGPWVLLLPKTYSIVEVGIFKYLSSLRLPPLRLPPLGWQLKICPQNLSSAKVLPVSA